MRRMWAESSPATCVYHARWAPIKFESQPVPGHPETFQSHAWFALPAADLDSLLLLLLSQDKHASGAVHFSQSAGATADVEVEAFCDSVEALRPHTRTICALRRGQGRYAIGVFVSFSRRVVPCTHRCV
jgi:hypothetical protein